MYGKLMAEYFELVQNEMKPILRLEDDEGRRELGSAIRNVLLHGIWPKGTSGKILRKDNFLINKIFTPMSAIMATMEVLEHISVYIRYFPYKKQGISPLGYLHYHIGNYLNELYILKSRLISYLNILEKAYAKSEQNKNVVEIIEPLRSAVSNALGPRTKARGYHIHEHRVSNKDLDHLQALYLFSKGNDELGQIMKQLFIEDYRKARKEWSIVIKREIGEIKHLLDFYFGELRNAIFLDKSLVIPDNHK